MHSFIYSTDFCLPHSTQNALAEIINAIYFPNPVDALQLQLYRLPLLRLTVAMIFFPSWTLLPQFLWYFHHRFDSPFLVSLMGYPTGYELVPYRVKLKTERWRIDDSELWSWRTLESPLDCKEIKPVNPKENQSRVFIGRTDAEAETPTLWSADVKNWLIGKDPDAGKDWRQEEKRMTEDEMVRWHHWLDGHVFEEAPGVGDGQGSLACCSPWGCKMLDMTEQLNLTEPYKVQPWTLSFLTPIHLLKWSHHSYSKFAP